MLCSIGTSVPSLIWILTYIYISCNAEADCCLVSETVDVTRLTILLRGAGHRYTLSVAGKNYITISGEKVSAKILLSDNFKGICFAFYSYC